MRLIFVLLLFNFTILEIFGSQTSGTWTLTADETLTGEIELTGDLTVNGGGYTLTAATGKRLFKTGSHKLVLNNVKLTGGDPSGATTDCGGGGTNSDGCSGGAVLVVGGTLEAKDTEFVSGKAFMGSAIFARNGATVTLTDCKVNNNENTKSNPDNYCAGGAIATAQSTTKVHIIRGEVNNNDIKHTTFGCKAGGLVASDGHFNVTGTTIKGNKGRSGGAIYIYRYASLTLTDAIVEDNTCTMRGGAMQIYEAPATITNSIIRNNAAPREGGGIFVQGWGNKLTTITGSTIQGNNRTGAFGSSNYDVGGAGICIGMGFSNYKVNVEIRQTTFKDNNDKDGNGHHIFTKRSSSDKPVITLVNNEYLGATGNIIGGHESGTNSATNFEAAKTCTDSPCSKDPFKGTCADLTDNKGVTCDCTSGTLEPSTYGASTCCGPTGCSGSSGGGGSSSSSGGDDSKITLEFGNNGSNDYIYNSTNDPDISLCLNKTYEFKRTTSGHPLRLVKDSDCTGCNTGTYSSLPTSSVTGWTDVSSGSPVDFKFTEAGTYYYVCTAHSGMVGKITVSDCSKCAINEHVVNNACVACPSGQVNIAGDDPSGGNTTCVTPCGENSHVIKVGDIYKCSPCEWGGTRAAGDVSTSNVTTTCSYPDCGLNEHVANKFVSDDTKRYGGTTCNSAPDCESQCDLDSSCKGYTSIIKKMVAAYNGFYVLMGDGNLKGNGQANFPSCTNTNCQLNSYTDLNGYIQNVKDISTPRHQVISRYFTCAVIYNGTVKCWGSDDHGTLGDGVASSGYQSMQDVAGITDAVRVYTGAQHVFVVLKNGTVKAWGSQYGGMLGNGKHTSTPTAPITVTAFTNPVTISMGYDHTCVLLTSGEVKCAGRNDHGQCGQGDGSDANIKTFSSTGITDAVELSCSTYYCCAVINDGTVKCWGENGQYQLGQGDTTDRKSPTVLADITTAVKLSCNYQHCCAVLSDGSVQCWGTGSYYRMGDGQNSNNIKPSAVSYINDAIDIYSAMNTVCALREDLTVSCWGECGQYQCGDGATQDQTYPSPATEITFMAPQHSYGSLVSGVGTTFSKDRKCHACDHGGTRAAGPGVLTGPDTHCICGQNAHVLNNKCHLCPTGSKNAAGDDSSGSDTICDICAENYNVVTEWKPSTNAYGGTSCSSESDCKTKCRADGSCRGYTDNTQFSWYHGYLNKVMIRDGKCTAVGENTRKQLSSSGSNLNTPTVVYAENCTHAAVGYNNGYYVVNNKLLWAKDGTDLSPAGVDVHKVFYNGVTSASQETLCIIDIDGKLYCKGDGAYGKLGQGSQSDSTSWVTPIGMESGVTDVKVTKSTVLAIKDGELWGWGSGNNVPTTETATYFYKPLNTEIKVKKIMIGDGSQNGLSCHIDMEDDLYCVGYQQKQGTNDRYIGSLEDGQRLILPPNGGCSQSISSNTYCRLPTKMNKNFKVRDAYVFLSHSMYAIGTDGKVYHYGRDNYSYKWREMGELTVDSYNYFWTWKDIGETNALKFQDYGHGDTNMRSVCYFKEDLTIKCKGHGTDTQKFVSGYSQGDPFTAINVVGLKESYTASLAYGPKVSGYGNSQLRDTSCKFCGSGYTHADNTPHGTADTTCTFTPCLANHHIKNGKCTACVSGTRVAGDNDPTSDTYCTCNLNEQSSLVYQNLNTVKYGGTACGYEGDCQAKCTSDPLCEGYSGPVPVMMGLDGSGGYSGTTTVTNYEMTIQECKDAIPNVRHYFSNSVQTDNKHRLSWSSYTHVATPVWGGVINTASYPKGCQGYVEYEMNQYGQLQRTPSYKVYYNMAGTDCSVVTSHFSGSTYYYRRWRFCIRPWVSNQYGPLIPGTANSYKKTIECSACPSGRTASTPVFINSENACDLQACGADSHVKNSFTKDLTKKYEGKSCQKDCEELCATDSTCEGYTLNNKVFGGMSHAGGNSYDHKGMIYTVGSTVFYLGRWNYGSVGTCSVWNGICTKYSVTSWDVADVTFPAKIVDLWVPDNQRTFWLLDNKKLYSLGNKAYGLMGDGSSSGNQQTPYEVMSGVTRTAKKMGRRYVQCAFKDKELWCWGQNYRYAIDKSEANNAYLTARKVADDIVDASEYGGTLCVVNTAGEVLCRGNGHYGAMGEEDRTYDTTTTDWKTMISSGATQIAVDGQYGICALVNGNLKCWGRSYRCNYLAKSTSGGSGNNCWTAVINTSPVDYEFMSNFGDDTIVELAPVDNGLFLYFSSGTIIMGTTASGSYRRVYGGYNDKEYVLPWNYDNVPIYVKNNKLENPGWTYTSNAYPVISPVYDSTYGTLVAGKKGDSYTRTTECSSCPNGTTNAAGDTIPAGAEFGLSSYCDRSTGCLQNEFVDDDMTCSSCPVGTFNNAGDTAVGSCDDSEICSEGFHVKKEYTSVESGKFLGSTCTSQTDCESKCGNDLTCKGYSFFSSSDITCSDTHTCTLGGGVVKCYGERKFLGNGENLNSYTATPTEIISSGAKKISCGTYSCLVLMEDGSVKCWGQGARKVCTTADKHSPHTITSLSNIVDIIVESYGYRACAQNNIGQVFCWGANIGNTATPTMKFQGPVFGDAYTAKQGTFARGPQRICLISMDNIPYCVGKNAVTKQYETTDNNFVNQYTYGSEYMQPVTNGAIPLIIGVSHYHMCIVYDKEPENKGTTYSEIAGNMHCVGRDTSSQKKARLKDLETNTLNRIVDDSPSIKKIQCHSDGCAYITNNGYSYGWCSSCGGTKWTSSLSNVGGLIDVVTNNYRYFFLRDTGNVYGYGYCQASKKQMQNACSSDTYLHTHVTQSSISFGSNYTYGPLESGEAYDSKIKSGKCSACPAGSGRAAGDDSGGALTFCGCLANNHVVNNVCTACPGVSTRPAGDDSGGNNTYCTCGANEYVSNKVCTTCPSGTTRPAGDDSSGADTVCLTAPCAKDYYVSGASCVKCPAGSSNAAGDTNANGDTYCDSDVKCQENEKVVNKACVSCPTGKHNTPGDEPLGPDTTCSWNTCAKDEYSDGTVCKTCLYGTFNEAGDPINVASTCDADDVCEVNEHISYKFLEKSDQQITNSGGYSSAITDFKKAQRLCIADSTCKGLTKDASNNYYLSDGTLSANTAYDAFEINRTEFMCHACAHAGTRVAGDTPAGGLTSCTYDNCAVNQYVDDYECKACPAGKQSATVNPSVGNSVCTFAPCGVNEHVKEQKLSGRLVVSEYHTCAVLNDDTVKCWGSGSHGRLGYGDTTQRTSPPTAPVDLGTGKTAKQLAGGGYYHTCAVLNDDTVKCWGSGSNGRLGYGDTNARGSSANSMGDNLPTVDLGTGKTATQLVAGGYHTCAILNDGAAKCWGYGSSGRLGYGDQSDRGDGANEMGDNLPTIDLGTGKTVKQLVAGGDHTCAVLNDDTVKCWGKNGYGQLGYADTSNRGDGANEMGNNLPTVDLGTGKTVKQLVAGQYHTCAVLNDDTVKCWGRGSNGQLGYGNTNDRGDGPNEMGNNLPTVNLGTGKTVKQLVAGSAHTCAVLNDDTVKCWGYGQYGQLGYGNTNNRGDGSNEMGNNLPTIDLGTGKSIKSLAAGFGGHTCAILNDDMVKCWGRNNRGQLGYGNTNNRGDQSNEMGNNLPTVDLGTGKTVITDKIGCVACPAGSTNVAGDKIEDGLSVCGICDANYYVKNTSNVLQCTACPGSVTNAAGDKVADGASECDFTTCGLNEHVVNHACVACAAGTFNDAGDSTSAANTACDDSETCDANEYGKTSLLSARLAAGGSHTCAILNDDTLKCWGNNFAGMLGYGDKTQRKSPPSETVNLGTGKTAKQVVAGGAHTCTILQDDTLKCWGMGSYGRLGYGDTNNRGDATGEMGDNLPAVNLGTGKTAKQVAAGSEHTCTILQDDSLKCWGRNTYGQLGYGDLNNRGDGTNEMGDNLAAIDLGAGKTAKQVVVGNAHTCALLNDDTVKCWGQTGYGADGYGDTTAIRRSPPSTTVDLGAGKTAKQLTAGQFYTCALLNDDTVKCWGKNGKGQLAYGDTTQRNSPPSETINLGTGKTVKQVSAGSRRTCALLNDDTVKCWGHGGYGKLGYGDTSDRGDATGEMGDNLPVVNLGTGKTAKQIAAGADHTCVVLDDDTVKCWGYGASGQLGYGDTNNRGDAAGEMGDNLPVVSLGAGKTVITELSECAACPGAGTSPAAKVDSGTTCTFPDCQTDQYSDGDGLCKSCPSGRTMPTAVNPGTASKCLCASGEYVSSGACASCPAGFTNAAGDDPAGADTTCDFTPCAVNHFVEGSGHSRVCTACPNGEFSPGGDATTCSSIEYCSIDQKVALTYASDNTKKYGGTSCSNSSDCQTKCTANSTCAGYSTSKTRPLGAGQYHMCYLVDDGTVKCLGQNTYGQLGSGSTTAQSGFSTPSLGKSAVAVDAGSSHSCALLVDKTIKCWGANGVKQLGDGTTTDRSSPVTVSGFTNVEEIATSYFISCARLTDGSVKCWGYKTGWTYQGLSLGTISIGGQAKIIRGGGNSMCVILTDDKLKCWGHNHKGQLGVGDTTNKNSPTEISFTGRYAVDIACGNEHCCVVLDDGNVRCSGEGDHGRLGYGNTDDRNTYGPNVELPSGKKAVKISCGLYSTYVTFSDGTATSWGSSSSFRLGYSSSSGNIGDASGEMGDNLSLIAFSTTVSFIDSFYNIRAAVLDDGKVIVWGDQSYGQLSTTSTSTIGSLTELSLGTNKKGALAYSGNYGPLITGAGTSFTKGKSCVDCPEGFQNEHRNSTLKDGPVNTCTVRNCVLNEFSDGSICKACPALSGAASAGLNPTLGVTKCTAITCKVDQYVESGQCKDCGSTAYRAAGDEIFGADTHCFCKDNHKVINKTCVACEKGSSNPNLCYSGLQDHYCVCDADYHVVNKVCTKCPAGTTRPAGDYGGNGDTHCLCGANQHVVNNVCTACPAGSTRAAGDNSGGANTYCTCGEDQHVVSNVCTPCAGGSKRPAGDDSSGADTSCSCKANEHVKESDPTAVKAWGDSNYGGADPGTITVKKAATNQYAMAVVKGDGTIKAWGDSNVGGTGAPSGDGFVDIFSSMRAFAAVKSDGSVKVWGDSNAGGSDPAITSGVVTIFSTDKAFAALKSDGSVESWGKYWDDNNNGWKDMSAPTLTGVTSISSTLGAFAAIKSDGSVAVWGRQSEGGTDPSITSGVVSIVGSDQAFAAIKSDGSVQAWGKAGKGGTNPSITSGVASIVSTRSAFAALKDDGSVKVWGFASEGGTNPGLTSGVVSIVGNKGAFAALKDDGSVKVWGADWSGGCDSGAGTTIYTCKPTLSNVVKIYSNLLAFCAVDSNGGVTCWGKKENGAEGPDPAITSGVVNIFSTEKAWAAVMSDGSVKVWGDSSQGGTDPSIGAGSGIVTMYSNNHAFLAVTGKSVSCSVCPAGSVRAAGDFPAGGVTSCACPEDFHVSGGQCVACVGGTRAAGDDPLAGNTHCTCKADHKVVSNVCTACPAGQERAAGDDASGADTTCLCKENYYSKGDGTCDACDTANGAVLAAGSDPSVASQCQCGAGYETSGATCSQCAATEESVAGEACKCKENHFYDGSACTACAAGSTNPAGDDKSATTSCTVTQCAENERVVSNVCTPCTKGMTRAAGDNATGTDTTCGYQGTAHPVSLSGNFGYKIDSGTVNGKLVIRKGSGLHTFYRDSAGNSMRIVSAADCAGSDCDKATYSTLPTSSLGLDDAEKDVAVTVFDPDTAGIGTYYYMSTTNGYRKGRIIVKPKLCKDLAVPLTSATTGTYTLTESCELDFTFTLTVDLTITFTLSARLRAQSGNVPTIFAKEGERHFHVSSGAKLSLKNIELKGGSPSGDGGAIKCDKCELDVDNVKFTDNTASVKGGAIHVRDSTSKIHLRNALFSGNQGTAGGAIAIVDADNVTISDSDFNSNIAATGDGGAIESSRDITVRGSGFLENRASSGDGGAIKMSSAKLTASGSSFRRNRAKRGGALKSSSGDLDFSNMVLEENEAVEDGGALDVEGSAEVDIRLSTIKKNKAKRGGAIRSKATASKKFRIRLSSLEENEAHESGGGGAVDLDGTGATKFMFQDSTMTGNKAAGSDNDLKKRGSSVKILAIDADLDDAKIDGGTRDSECVTDQCTGRADSTCKTRTGGTTCECNSGKYLHADKSCHTHKVCTGLGLSVQIKAPTATNDRLCGSPDVAQISYALDDKGKELAALVEKRLIADGVSADAAYGLAVEVFGEVNKCE